MAATAVGLPDDVLITRWRAGDPLAFEQLYARWKPQLVSLAVRRFHDPILAEDLAQETFVRALRYLDQFDTARRFWPWLHRIWDRATADYMRANPPVELVDVTTVSDELVVEHHASRVVNRELLTAAVASLSRAERDAFVAVDVHGLAPHEAAAHLGQPPDALRQRLSRGRARLRRALHDQGLPLWLPAGWRQRWSKWQLQVHTGENLAPGLSAVVAHVAAAVLVVFAPLPQATVAGHPVHPHRSPTAAARVEDTLRTATPPSAPRAVAPNAPPQSASTAPLRTDSATSSAPATSDAGAPTGRGPDQRRLPQLQPVTVPVVDERVHQEDIDEPEYDYGIAVPVPGREPVRSGQRSSHEEETRTLDETACALAQAAPTLTYCITP